MDEKKYNADPSINGGTSFRFHLLAVRRASPDEMLVLCGSMMGEPLRRLIKYQVPVKGPV